MTERTRSVTLTVIAGSLALAFPAIAQTQAGNPRGAPVPPLAPGLPPDGGGPDGPGTFDLSWYTIDGGGATYLTGGLYSIGGTVGQPDAGFMSGGVFELGGGFWFGVITVPCYANCDNSTTLPILNVLDFSCFLNAFSAGDSYANCDHSTSPPVLNVLDFSCFINAFAAGCP